VAADPYVYPGTTILRNLAGLQDAAALADREAQTSTLRQLALDAGHSLAWQRLDQATLVLASQQSFEGDNDPLRELVERVLDLPER
jgi:fido (protein-threonine AMPylation protein)